jgi:hypothetical protein
MLKFFVSIAVLLFVQCTVFGESYPSIMKRAFNQMDSDFGKFVWVTYPTNNNGVLSMGRSRNDKYELGDSRCPTFTCMGLSETLIDDPNGIKINNMVTLNAGDPGILDNNETKQSIIDATLPHFLKIVGITLNSNRKQVVDLDFTFGSLIRREILPAEVIGYLDTIKDNPNATLTQKSLFRLYGQKQLSIITKDIVIEKMSFTISINNINNFGVGAELDQKVGKIFGQDTTLKVGITKVANNKYTLETTRPLIIARYYQNVKKLID